MPIRERIFIRVNNFLIILFTLQEHSLQHFLIIPMARSKNIALHTNSIIVDFEIDASLVHILIKNSELHPLLNVKIKPSAPIVGLGGNKDLSKLNVFKEIKYLAPQKELKIFVDSYESFFRNLKQSTIDFTITFQDTNNKSYKTKISHDLKIYLDLILLIKK